MLEFIDNPFSTMVIIGLFLTIIGYIFYFFPPKKINMIYGYRTTRSMSSQKRWDFAQKFSSKLMGRYGLILTLLGIIFSFVSDNKTAAMITTGITFFSLIGIIFYKTEKKLKSL